MLFDEVKKSSGAASATNMHKTVASTVGRGLTWPNVVWKLGRGATMTDKEIRSDEAAVVQRPSEEALRDSEERYRTMIGNLPGFVYRCQNDRDWTMSFMSDGCRDITGYAPEDFLHNKKLAFNDIIRQDYRERVWLNVQNCVQQKKAFQHEYPIVVASGETDHWVWERGRGIFSDAGQLLYIEGFISDITERKQAEETLQNERLLLRTLIDNIPDSIYSKDLACRKTLANSTEVRYLGVKSEADVLGKDDFDIYPKELAEKFFADDQLVMLTGEPVLNREEYILDEKQQKRWLLSSKLPLRNQEGRIIGLVGIGRDITARKHAEEEAQRERAFFDQLVETAPEGIAIADTKGRIMRVNAEFVRMFGYGVDEVVGQYLDDLVAPPARQEEAEVLTRSTIQGGKNLRETVRRRKDGTLVDVSLIGASILVAGKQEAVYAIYRDITDRKRAEEALRESEALYQSLVKVSPLSICRKDLAGRFTFANQRFLEALNLSLADLIGLTDFDLHPPELAEKYRRDDRAVMDSGQAREFIEERAVLGGESRVIQSYKTPIYDGAGKINGVQISFWDITERKQAETEKEALQAQLHQSQKMEAIGTLAGGVAHDFNNLLTGILGNIALIRGGLLAADPLLENLNAAETAARQAADLTQGLLTFGRSAAILPVALDVDAAVGETLDLLHQSLPATINIVRDFQPDAWNILADRSQLTQILLNLAVNARDAMEGKGTLTFSVRNEVVDELYVRQYPYAQTGEYVRLSVNDTGPGIPDEIMEHLFEPFHTTKPVGSGTGLGLSVIYGAVKQSGGWITTTTGHDTGTTFNIFLPRCVSPAVPVQTPRPIVENIQHSTVLVVEDEPVVRTVTQSLLTRSGYLVMTAGNGAEALDMIAQHRKEIDLIMLDMTMPGMTTGEIVRAIRALDPTVPILLNSGFASNKTAKQILEEDSVQGFLAKPYDLHQLLEKVQSLLCRG
ncbi:PAS domain S-box protein [Candidatus Cryosericum odellii]|uniref:histidine kinase n=2 Tax=Candidatus Cryosericum odellii TaxID=2290917 RepID=A0A398DQ38_9BACT|nr:PAS domain S-box protein [Candidatus Cryosericum odellii]